MILIFHWNCVIIHFCFYLHFSPAVIYPTFHLIYFLHSYKQYDSMSISSSFTFIIFINHLFVLFFSIFLFLISHFILPVLHGLICFFDIQTKFSFILIFIDLKLQHYIVLYVVRHFKV